MASGKTCTSMALSAPPGPGSAATPINAPGFTSARLAGRTSVTVVLSDSLIVWSWPARVRASRLPPSAETLVMVARATARGWVWAAAGIAQSGTRTQSAARSDSMAVSRDVIRRSGLLQGKTPSKRFPRNCQTAPSRLVLIHGFDKWMSKTLQGARTSPPTGSSFDKLWMRSVTWQPGLGANQRRAARHYG